MRPPDADELRQAVVYFENDRTLDLPLPGLIALNRLIDHARASLDGGYTVTEEVTVTIVDEVTIDVELDDGTIDLSRTPEFAVEEARRR